MGEVLLRIGVARDTELRLILGSYVHATDPADPRRDVDGFNDIGLGFKYRLLRNEGWAPDLAILGTLTFPTGATHIGAEAVQPLNRVVAGRWWRPDERGTPAISIERDIARTLGVDPLEVRRRNFYGIGERDVVPRSQRMHWMQEELLARIKSSVESWARATFESDDVVVGLASEDDVEDEEDGTRFLVDFAVRQEGRWLVAEVWVDDGVILSINDLGEGLPLDDSEWPWPAMENS